MSTTVSATPVPGGTADLRVPDFGRPCRSVLMVGTSPQVRGGISTVVRGYQDAGLFDRFDSAYVVTHRDGSAFVKVRTAAAAYARLVWLLTTADAPLVHIHISSRASFWRKAIVCGLTRLWRRPYLLHAHGSEFSKFYDAECGGFSKWLVRTVFRKAALVFALSAQWNDELLRISPRATVRTLPNAVRLHDPSPPSAPDAPMRILFAGRIGARKGTFELLQAFARVAPKYPRATLVCAGDGEVEKLRSLSAELNVADRVSCPGWLSPEAMQDELARATVFALPSHAEGVPMALLEAMSRSLPVLTTPVGGIPGVVENDRNGLLVPPGDVDAIERALTKLLDSAQDRTRLGAAARETIAQRFSITATIEQLAAIYRRFGVQDRNATETQRP
jgi:glycosyltransferase involved in cell wall biosynthesis